MWSVWQSLGESVYFFRRHFFSLARLLLPLALPAFLGAEYRAWGVLHGEDKLVNQDVTLLLINAVIGLYAVAITTTYAVAEVQGRRPPAADILRGALFAVPSLMALQLLMFLALLLVSWLVVVPALWLVVMVPGLWLLACLMPACVYVVAERQPVPVALQTSFRNFRPLAWQLLAALLLVSLGLFLPLMASALALSGLIGKLSSLPARMLLSALVDALALLLSQLWPVLMVRYYDMQRQSGSPEPQ